MKLNLRSIAIKNTMPARFPVINIVSREDMYYILNSEYPSKILVMVIVFIHIIDVIN